MPRHQVLKAEDATDPQKNITVFASAGTGKTYLLIRRILRLLLNDVDPAHILAITFTRKAAAEMRERLMKVLEDWAGYDDRQMRQELQGLGAVDPTASGIKKAKRLYERLLFAQYEARITTFHAFCQDILRRFALHAEVPAGFEIVENTEELKREARERLYHVAHQGTAPGLGEALFELLKHGGGVYNVDEMLNAFIDSCNDWRSFTQNQTDAVAYACDCLDGFLFADQSEEDDDPSTLIADLQRYQFYLDRHATATYGKYSRMIADSPTNNDEAWIWGIKGIFLKSDNTPRTLKPSRALEKSLGSEEMETFIHLHERLVPLVMQRLNTSRKKNLAALNQAWFTAGHRLLTEYRKLKYSRHALDFDDLEWYTCQLLSQHVDTAWIQYKLDQRIEHILIDEFQDTNPTQWGLLLPLLKELAAQKSDKSLFLVGDTKQSIYGFRRANPRLQATASAWARENLAARRLDTDRSFRSSPAIIGLVNRIFGGDIQAALLDEFRPHEAKKTALWGGVYIAPPIVVEDNAEEPLYFRDPLRQARTGGKSDGHYLEGQAVARQIKALLERPTPVHDPQQTRAARYGDVMILARQRTHLPQLELALKEENIPYCSVGDNDLPNQLEVQDLLALLTYLVQPHNDLALAQVLRSPCFGVGDDELMQLATYTPAAWSEKLATYAAKAPDSLLGEAHRQLQEWRGRANQIPVHDLLDRIYFDIDLPGRYASVCPPIKRSHVSANLTHLLQLALDLDAGRYSNIQSFVDAIRTLDAGRAPVRHTDRDDEDAVQIMTIHAAKGLESPIVFLVDAGSSPRDWRAYQTYVNWPDDPEQPPDRFFIIGRKDRIDTNTREVLEQQAQEAWREELNMLYVALTRAKQYLFISGVKKKRSRDNNWLSMIERILEDHPEERENGAWMFNYGDPPEVAPPERRDETPAAAARLADISKRFAPVEQRDAPAPDTASARYGKLVHKLFELVDPEALQSRRALHIEAERTLGNTVDEQDFSAAWREVKKCLEAPALREVFSRASDENILKEVAICVIENGTVLHRIIDRLIVTEDWAWIVDFKTSATVTSETVPQRAKEYREQIDGYVSAVRKLYPDKKVRASILFTRLPALHNYAIDDG